MKKGFKCETLSLTLPLGEGIKGFTLAEVLITLLIIGIVAALTIPSVISNYQQQEFKTGLKKAVSVLNEAIQTNIAIDGETLQENIDYFTFFKKRMNVIKSGDITLLSRTGRYLHNSYFYTSDGMKFFVGSEGWQLHENADLHASMCRGCHCGSYGLYINNTNSNYTPCVIGVDVNGDKGPSPVLEKDLDASSRFGNLVYSAENYIYPKPSDKKLTDVFTIMITDEKAVPFGVVAQRAMYSSK